MLRAAHLSLGFARSGLCASILPSSFFHSLAWPLHAGARAISAIRSRVTCGGAVLPDVARREEEEGCRAQSARPNGAKGECKFSCRQLVGSGSIGLSASFATRHIGRDRREYLQSRLRPRAQAGCRVPRLDFHHEQRRAHYAGALPSIRCCASRIACATNVTRPRHVLTSPVTSLIAV